MRPSDPAAGPRRERDWRGLAMLAWVGGFGLLYARMVLECKAPGLARAVRSLAGRLFGP
jgi:hypothetical protein